jgi:energy-coupling factor transporter transmembrane protein EcfT
MAYRYLFLLLGSVTDMYEARKARTVGAQAHDRQARAFLFASAGTLFGKAHTLSEEVHQAMVARGYRGDVHTIAVSRLTMRDAAAAVVVLVAAITIYGGDRILGR